jgi:acetyl esterase/lipase
MTRGLVHALSSLRGSPTDAVAPSLTTSYAPRRRGIAPLADLYLPTTPTGESAVLVHGGGFVIGSRRMKPMRFLGVRLSAAGIAVFAIDYRMIFRGGRLDEAIADVRAALAYWRTSTTAHGLDANAISLVGLSAGGSLAMLVAAMEAPGSIASLACCFGVYDWLGLRGAASVLPRLLLRTADRAAWRERSPGRANVVVPTLLLHGDADSLVSVEQARLVAADREARGLPTRLVVYPDAAHGFFNVPGDAADAGTRELIGHVTRRT